MDGRLKRKEIIVIIPAYNPTKILIKLVNSLFKVGFKGIIIVNDGSDRKNKNIFSTLAKKRCCHILTHAVNLGKGRSLKTAFNYILNKFPDKKGIITVDADGQHSVKDIIKIAESLCKNKNKLIIGARSFKKNVPFRSLFGNIITRYIFFILVGKKIIDTQSGLRGIPFVLLPKLLKLSGEGYEYEINVLISTKENHISIHEERIDTIYIDKNSSSHFNPLFDSMKIYFVLFRFAGSSFFTAFIDFMIFTIVYIINHNILVSIIIARLIASLFNFVINKKFVFNASSNLISSIIKYYCLLIIMGTLSFFIIKMFHLYFGINIIISKLVTESMLFFVSFFIQRDYIFLNKQQGN